MQSASLPDTHQDAYEFQHICMESVYDNRLKMAAVCYLNKTSNKVFSCFSSIAFNFSHSLEFVNRTALFFRRLYAGISSFFTHNLE